MRAKERHHVLVVDDNADGAEMLSRFLRLIGHEVDVANDAASALEIARARPPRVAILDIGLPDIDGFLLARKLREELGERTTLIALTAFSSDTYRERAARAGFDAYYVKPAPLEEIERALRDLPSSS